MSFSLKKNWRVNASWLTWYVFLCGRLAITIGLVTIIPVWGRVLRETFSIAHRLDGDMLRKVDNRHIINSACIGGRGLVLLGIGVNQKNLACDPES